MCRFVDSVVCLFCRIKNDFVLCEYESMDNVVKVITSVSVPLDQKKLLGQVFLVSTSPHLPQHQTVG